MRGSSSQLNQWSLESRGSSDVNQLEGTEGCASISPSFSRKPRRENIETSLGQYHSASLSEEAGVSPIARPLDTDRRDPGLLPGMEDNSSANAHQRGPQCSGRRRVERPSGLDRVETGQYDIREPVSIIRSSPGRSVCYKGKHAVTSVCIAVSGRVSDGDRCDESGLERVGLDLSVSSVSSSECGDSEASGVQRHGFPDSSRLANTSLVLQSDDEVSSALDFEGFPSVPNNSGGSTDLPTHRPLQSERLATIDSEYLQISCPPLVREILLNKHSRSTKKQYQTVWNKFMSFLRFKELPFDKVTIVSVLDFLSTEYNNNNREYKTIATYKNALKDPLKGALHLDLDCPIVTDFMTGLRRKKPPRRSAPMPSWDLEDLLKHLRSAV